MCHVFKSDKLKVVNSKGVKYSTKLNNQIEKRLVVSKYIKLSNLEKSIRNKSFYFSSPLEWLDPFELLFYRPVMRIGNNNSFTVHACCFACNDIENEEGFWQIWSKNEKEPIVRVTYNVINLLTALNASADDRYDFYLGGMEYKKRKEILAIARHPSDQYNQIDDYLNKLCLKRNAYKYENELRLFVKKESDLHNENDPHNTIIENIDYNSHIITEITLPPSEPFGNSHPAKDKMKRYQKCVNAFTKLKIQKIIEDGFLSCRINQSALYCVDVNKRSYKI